MSERERFLYILGAGLLLLLFLMSSTDLIIKEKDVEIYPVSVIINDDRDEDYVNFKKGMDKAAEEFNVDVSFITLYSSNDQEQQLELVRREIRDGAKAIILAPVNEDDTVMSLDSMKLNCPFVFLDAQSPSEFVTDSIMTDWKDMGEKLGSAAAAGVSPEVPVCLFTEGLSFTGNTGIYDGVRTVLEERGYVCRLYEKKSEDTYREAIGATVYPDREKIAAVALDSRALREVSQIIGESSVYEENVEGLYGVGSTTEILYDLDQGIIDGIVTYDRFTEGYLSVKRAVEAIEGNRQKRQTILEAYYLEREDLRDKAYEKMLYPIE